jgi:hypothetical protein
MSLWFLLLGTVLPLLLVLVDFFVAGNPIDRLFSFNHFLFVHWFLIAVVVWALMVPLSSVHALLLPAAPWWHRISWALSFWLVGPIAIPLYCLFCLHNPASRPYFS